MATEVFSKQDFDNSLMDLPHEELGIIRGEYCYSIPLGNAKILVRSSVGPSGFTDDESGADSIRMFLMNNDGDFIISEKAKLMDWVTRVAGWKSRMHERIENLIGILDQIPTCSQCGKLLHVNIVQKQDSKYRGMLFVSCENRTHSNPWKIVKKDSKMAVGEYLSKHGKTQNETTVKESVVKVTTPLIKKTTFVRPDLSRLNKFQLAVVNNRANGPCLVTASAGSGKTTTMTEMVLNMIFEGIDPSRMLVITFTNKAAAEMRIKIARSVWPDLSENELKFFGDPNQASDDPFAEKQLDRNWVEQDPIRTMLVDWVCTIHAMCLRLLKSTGRKVNVLKGPPHEYQVKQIIKDSLDEFGWKASPKQIEWWIDHAVNNLIETYNSKSFFERELAGYPDLDESVPEWLSEIYFRYIKYCGDHNLVSFSMMQAQVLKGIRKDRSFLDELMSKFDYIIVDEGQDTDWLQAEIIFSIMKNTRNVSFIGDTRQSIYRFKGAVPEIMETHFAEHWGEVKIFTMPINYRSDAVIVEAGNKLIRNNYRGREDKVVDALPRPDAPRGDPMEYESFGDFRSMCDGMVRKLIDDSQFGDWFILSRTRAECASIHTELIKAGIPAVNLSGGLLLGSSHIRKVLAYMQLSIDYHGARDNMEVVREIANISSNKFVAPLNRRRHEELCKNEKPWIDCGCPVILREGIDISPVRYYGAQSVNAAGSWENIQYQRYETNKGGHPTLASKGATDLVYFVEYLEQFSGDALACLNRVIEDSIMPWITHEEGLSDADDPSENGKQEDFDVLREMIKPGMTVEQFLEDMDDLSKRAEKSDTGSVEIATIHKVKGLEKPKVILNLTRLPIKPPKRKEGELPVGIPTTIEDERNLAYVGATRARNKLVVMESEEWLGQRMDYSPFVEELGFSFEQEDAV